MWRYALAFLIASHLAAFTWIALFPDRGAIKDSQGVLLCSAGVLLLVADNFFVGLLDDSRLREFLKFDSRGALLAFLAGGVIGMVAGAASVPVFRHWDESLWVACLPIGLYLAGFFGLQIVFDRAMDGD